MTVSAALIAAALLLRAGASQPEWTEYGLPDIAPLNTLHTGAS